MRSSRRRVVPIVTAACTLTLVSVPAANAGVPTKAKKSCQLLRPVEITSAFGIEAGEGTQQGGDCTWNVGDLAVSLELITKDAKSTFEALRDLASDAGAQPQKVTGVRDRAVYAEIQSFKELLVLKGKKFLFLRVLDIASPIDSETAKTALTDLGKKAAKRV
jgi:hypothetical protein